MKTKVFLPAILAITAIFGYSCKEKKAQPPEKDAYPVTLVTLDPGHFHAALVQKSMYPQVNPDVFVYAPAGADVQDHLKKIENYNTRGENPTNWNEIVYTGTDFFQKMLTEGKGNVVALSGNNRRKAEYIKACVDAGLNVLADKPMCIDENGFELLKRAFDSAKRQNVLLYDIMTERYEITTILQKELAHIPAVFGQLKPGSEQDPSVVKESVHHFFKYVSGNPLKRPGWFFDTSQQGEGIVDVTTHLVDLTMWEAFPEQTVDYSKDIKIVSSKRWPTLLTKQQYQQATQLDDFPDYLKDRVDDKGNLACYSNGQINYTLRGVYMKVSVLWNYQAPEGAGDTHYSIMKGTKADVIILQGAEQKYRPELYIQPAEGFDKTQLAQALAQAMQSLQAEYPGIKMVDEKEWFKIEIPDSFRLGHEAHFAQVTEKYLRFLADGRLPDWEVPNMLAKYYTTTQALKLAQTCPAD